jgi:UDP-3-O-[3-hydroxymyristoyl] glucosamine N-acyltransferase
MKRSLKDLASNIAGELSGDAKLSVYGVSNLEDASERDITFATDDKAVEKFNASRAAAAVVPLKLKKFPTKPYIKVPNVKLAMAKVLALFEQKKNIKPGIHKTALIRKNAKVGKNVCVMNNVTVGENTSIGDNVVIYSGVYIGNECKVGRNTVIYPNAVMYDRTIVGENCIIHAGVVLGVDGYGFVPIDGTYEKVPQIGNVVIEDNVEIFANVCISRATMGSTLIKKGSKIDNLSHIAHNCKLGENCAITGLVAIAGSSELGDHVSIGGTSGIVDHVRIGENTVVMARSGVTKDIPANSVISGFPAQDHKIELEQQANIRRLPKLIEKINELEKQIKK